jgi:hypothetical protein
MTANPNDRTICRRSSTTSARLGIAGAYRQPEPEPYGFAASRRLTVGRPNGGRSSLHIQVSSFDFRFVIATGRQLPPGHRKPSGNWPFSLVRLLTVQVVSGLRLAAIGAGD